MSAADGPAIAVEVGAPEVEALEIVLACSETCLRILFDGLMSHDVATQQRLRQLDDSLSQSYSHSPRNPREINISSF
jgi:hypothetical protein